MSTYAVWGMTRERALEDVRREMATHAMGVLIPLADWTEAVNAEVDKIMAGTHIVQLSDKYDAPQFAREWLEKCKQTCVHRNLHVKAYRRKEARSQKTGRALYEWIEVP